MKNMFTNKDRREVEVPMVSFPIHDEMFLRVRNRMYVESKSFVYGIFSYD